MRRTARALLLLLLLLLAPLGSAAWTTEGGDASRAGTVSAPIPTSAVELLWNASGQYVGALVLPDGAVVGWGDPVTVWEKDGTQRWSTRTVGPQTQVFVARGAALLSNGTIVAAGSLPFGAPAIVGYDPKDGKQFLFDRTITGKCDSLEENAVAVAADDSFYVGGCGPGIVAYTKDGAKRWNFTVDAERVALGTTHVYAEVEDLKLANGTTYGDALVALSQADGSIAWAAKLDGNGGDPIVAKDGTIFLVDDGQVRAFGPDGTPKWKTIVPRPYGLALAPNGTVASASSNSLSWLSPTDGKLLGTSRTFDGTQLLVGAGAHLRIYGANVIAVDNAGTELWRVNGTARNFDVKPAIADDGTLYLPEEGKMRAYRGEGGATAPTQSATPVSTPPASSTPAGATPSGDAAQDGGKDAPGFAAPLLLAAAAVALALRRQKA